MFRSVIASTGQVCHRLDDEIHQEECFHFIFHLWFRRVDVQDRCVASSWDFTILFDRLEYLPSLFAILRVTRQAEGDEEGFDSFGSQDVTSVEACVLWVVGAIANEMRRRS